MCIRYALYFSFLPWNGHAKDIAKWRAKDIKLKLESMKQYLQREKRINSIALVTARSAQRENAATPRVTRAATPPPPQHPPLPPSSSLAVARADSRESVQMRGWRQRGHGRGTSPPASPAWLGRRAWNQIRWRACSVGCGPRQRRSCLCSWGMELAAAGGPSRGGRWPQQIGLGAAVRSGGPVAGFAVPEADAGCGAPAGELPMVVRQ
jgi:hypothetical protein|uniref:Uncharacterized protein n=1 Tax=Zea mays TaxID=4577 RepID=A0A804P8L3_MAIZE